MKTKEVENIYLEYFIPNKQKIDIWNNIIATEEFQSLFPEPQFSFPTNSSGILNWKKFFFIDINAEYFVESCEEAMHLLLKIHNNVCSSLLLFTFEEDMHGVLFRLDHRSFSGISKHSHQKSFLRRWNKLFKSIMEKK